jgi:hypothetical protein
VIEVRQLKHRDPEKAQRNDDVVSENIETMYIHLPRHFKRVDVSRHRRAIRTRTVEMDPKNLRIMKRRPMAKDPSDGGGVVDSSHDSTVQHVCPTTADQLQGRV